MWGSEVERERRSRIKLSVYAYAYEFENDSLVDDATFDDLSRKINVDIDTGHDTLDEFFKKEFQPDTGMWIRKHPDLHGLKFLYDAYKENKWLKRIFSRSLDIPE